jgi:hypothetical protein
MSSAGHRREEGAVAVFIAIMLVALMAAVALAVDAGGLYLRRRELVNGSDAGAMSAARTCARGGFDDRFGSPEQASDFQAQQNAPLTTGDVAGLNIIEMTACGHQSGHVSVSYTSNQSLFFAPVLGFDSASPVTTAATASWGLGSNNPVPLVISDLGAVNCPVPPSGVPTIGQTCSFWYDNDRFQTGNFGFLSLNPQGWDVPIDYNCAGAQSGGTNSITGWIDGSIPASLPLNWMEPTYVCTDTGIRGVGNDTQGRPWKALEDLIGETRDFPINWEGPGRPVPSAPEQGTVYKDTGNQGTLDSIDKFDIIGFAFLTIVDVVSRNEAEGGEGSCSTTPSGPYTWTTAGETLDLNAIRDGSGAGGATWKGCPTRVPDGFTSVPIVTQAKSNDPACCTYSSTCPPAPGTDYCWDEPSGTITWNGAVPTKTKITFTWLIDPNNGPCGPLPENSSAHCIVTTWQGSTLDDTFVPTDKNQVIRLCDYDYGTCLDQ